MCILQFITVLLLNKMDIMLAIRAVRKHLLVIERHNAARDSKQEKAHIMTTQTIAYIHAALIAQVADGDIASLDAQIAEAGLTRADVTIETGLLIGDRAEVEEIAGADIRWVDSIPALTGGDCAYRLNA